MPMWLYDTPIWMSLRTFAWPACLMLHSAFAGTMHRRAATSWCWSRRALSMAMSRSTMSSTGSRQNFHGWREVALEQRRRLVKLLTPWISFASSGTTFGTQTSLWNSFFTVNVTWNPRSSRMQRRSTIRTSEKELLGPSRTSEWGWRYRWRRRGCRSWEAQWSGSARRGSLQTASQKNRLGSWWPTDFATTRWSSRGIRTIRRQRRRRLRIGIVAVTSLPKQKWQELTKKKEMMEKRCQLRIRSTTIQRMRKRWWCTLRTSLSMSTSWSMTTSLRVTTPCAMSMRGFWTMWRLLSISWRSFDLYFSWWLYCGFPVWCRWRHRKKINVLLSKPPVKNRMVWCLDGSKEQCWQLFQCYGWLVSCLERHVGGAMEENIVFVKDISLTREFLTKSRSWKRRTKDWKEASRSTARRPTTSGADWLAWGMRTMTLLNTWCSWRTRSGRSKRRFNSCKEGMLSWENSWFKVLWPFAEPSMKLWHTSNRALWDHQFGSVVPAGSGTRNKIAEPLVMVHQWNGIHAHFVPLVAFHPTSTTCKGAIFWMTWPTGWINFMPKIIWAPVALETCAYNGPCQLHSMHPVGTCQSCVFTVVSSQEGRAIQIANWLLGWHCLENSALTQLRCLADFEGCWAVSHQISWVFCSISFNFFLDWICKWKGIQTLSMIRFQVILS